VVPPAEWWGGNREVMGSKVEVELLWLCICPTIHIFLILCFMRCFLLRIFTVDGYDVFSVMAPCKVGNHYIVSRRV